MYTEEYHKVIEKLKCFIYPSRGLFDILRPKYSYCSIIKDGKVYNVFYYDEHIAIIRSNSFGDTIIVTYWGMRFGLTQLTGNNKAFSLYRTMPVIVRRLYNLIVKGDINT